MTEQELLQMRDLAEDGKVQFKERIIDKYDIGCEMVAFSNSRGGRLIIGVNYKSGIINALSYKELQETTNPRKSNQTKEESNQESNQEYPNLVTRKLTKEEKDIRNFCSVPRTAQEIMDRLGVTNQSKNRQKYITSLIEIGVLERTIPENPKDRNQKYRRKK